MKTELLDQAIERAREGFLLVATADLQGTAHVAVARRVQRAGPDKLFITEWFCPGTMANIQLNPRVSIVAWNPASDQGLQLIGLVERIEELAVMNGYSPRLEQRPAVPQTENQLLVQVEKIFAFHAAPHSDTEEDLPLNPHT